MSRLVLWLALLAGTSLVVGACSSQQDATGSAKDQAPAMTEQQVLPSKDEK